MHQSDRSGAVGADRSRTRTAPAWLICASMALMAVATILLVVFGQ